MVFDLLQLAEYKAELEASRLPTTAPSSSSTDLIHEDASRGLLTGPAASSSGFLGAFVVTGTGYACAHVAAIGPGIVIDQVELYAPAIGGTQIVGLYRRPALEAMTPVSAFPTGGVPLTAETFASALVGPPPPPDGTMVLTPGAMQQRRELGWFIPAGAGFSIVGAVGVDIAFGIYFHELVT